MLLSEELTFLRLCQTALFNTQKKQRENPGPDSRKQMKVFWFVLLFIILWQFLPEYAFPMVGSLSFLCWVAPENATANFLGAGFGGMSLLNLSFDWSSFNLGQYKLVSHSMVDSSHHVCSICIQLLDFASCCKVWGFGAVESSINVQSTVHMHVFILLDSKPLSTNKYQLMELLIPTWTC
jgi:hypothetical protein